MGRRVGGWGGTGGLLICFLLFAPYIFVPGLFVRLENLGVNLTHGVFLLVTNPHVVKKIVERLWNDISQVTFLLRHCTSVHVLFANLGVGPTSQRSMYRMVGS